MKASYIDYSRFKRRYIIKDIIYNERGNIVYDCGEYVVKETRLLSTLITEVGISDKFSHPCMMKIKDYSFNDDKYYYSMLKGIDIITAYSQGLINIKDIIRDLVSVIKFLHDNGIGHFDIKGNNVIYLNNRATLIDFELAIKCKYYDNSYHAIGNDAYTVGFKDPEFVFINNKSYNSIICDYYALGMTIYDIYHKTYMETERDCYYPNLDTVYDDIKDFIQYCILPHSERDINNIVHHKICADIHENDDYKGIVHQRLYGRCNVIYNDISKRYYTTVMDWLLKTMNYECYNTDVVFRTIHLYHYLLYSLDDIVKNKDKLQLYAVCSMLIMSNLFSSGSSVSDMNTIGISKYNILHQIFTIIHNDYIIFNTYFDIADNIHDTSILLITSLRDDYNPYEIPISDTDTVKVDDNDYNNIGDVYNYIKSLISPETSIFNSDIFKINHDRDVFHIRSLKIPIISFEEYKYMISIIKTYHKYKINLDNIITVVMRYRHYNHMLDTDDKDILTEILKTNNRYKQLIRYL